MADDGPQFGAPTSNAPTVAEPRGVDAGPFAGRQSSLFDASNDALFLETDLEASTPQGVPGAQEPPESLTLFSRSWRQTQNILDDIMEDWPYLKKKFRLLMLEPLQDILHTPYDFLQNQFRAQGLIFEAELMTALWNGWWRRTQSGEPPLDFTKPGGGEMTVEEVFIVGFRVEAEKGVQEFRKQDEQGAQRFLDIMQGKIAELSVAVNKKYPGMANKPNMKRVVMNHMGYRIGQEFMQAVKSGGITEKGELIYIGKAYNLKNERDVTRLLNTMMRGRFPLEEMQIPDTGDELPGASVKELEAAYRSVPHERTR